MGSSLRSHSGSLSKGVHQERILYAASQSHKRNHSHFRESLGWHCWDRVSSAQPDSGGSGASSPQSWQCLCQRLACMVAQTPGLGGTGTPFIRRKEEGARHSSPLARPLPCASTAFTSQEEASWVPALRPAFCCEEPSWGADCLCSFSSGSSPHCQGQSRLLGLTPPSCISCEFHGGGVGLLSWAISKNDAEQV